MSSKNKRAGFRKPDSVLGGHLSNATTREFMGAGHTLSLPICLAPGGGYLLYGHPYRTWALTPRFHPYPF